MTTRDGDIEGGGRGAGDGAVPTAPRGPAALSQRVVAFAAVGLVMALSVAAFEAGGEATGRAAALGALAGFALYHAAFGFTGGWRRFVRERRGAGIRAQCLLVALTAAGIMPLVAWGEAIGVRAGGFVFPVGPSTALGAFLFGLGMQLAGGCGSGTLFVLGGGSTRMFATLAAFVTGSFAATLHLPFWTTLPHVPPVSLAGTALGVPGALALTLALLAAIALATVRAERARHGALDHGARTGSLARGPWSPALGAAVLALVGVLTVLALGRPWGITSAFALWGAKIAHGLGFPLETAPVWADAIPYVERTILADATSVMNLGIVLGALAAAGWAGRFAPTLAVGRRDLATALAGGLLMGYGARLAFGCNIGGLLGGIASGSLHGWSWLVFGFLGTILGVALRARLGIDPPERRTD